MTGNTNTIQSNQSDENTGDGYNIAGTGNIVKDNKANKNTEDGFDLSGTGQKLTGSASSGDASCEPDLRTGRRLRSERQQGGWDVDSSASKCSASSRTRSACT